MDEEFPGLFLTFASTEPTEQGILAFANRYGLLGVRELRRGKIVPNEMHTIWRDQIRGMHDRVAEWRARQASLTRPPEGQEFYQAINKYLRISDVHPVFKPDFRPASPLAELYEQLVFPMKLNERPSGLAVVELVPSPSGDTVTFELKPSSLRHALWVQFAQAIAGSKEFRECPNCGRWFDVAPDTRRADARFCREGCRVSAYKHRRREAKRLAEDGKTPREIAKLLGTSAKVAKGWIDAPSP